MSLAELLYGTAFILFMLGTAGVNRRQSPSDHNPGLALAFAGLLLDFTVTAAPWLGCPALKMHVEGSNSVLVFAVIGGVTVWASGFILLALRNRIALTTLQNGLVAIQVLWFVDYIAFAYGMHVYPLYP